MERGIESGPKGDDSVFENIVERATIKSKANTISVSI
jgi:hypothetical protein